MQKNKFIIITLLIALVTSVHIDAIELKPTPIQEKLSNSILLAADNWELDETKNVQQNSSEEKIQKKEHKSPMKAALYSALLPGLGEHYVGNRTKSKVFFAAEAATWVSYIAMYTYAKWKKDDMVRFANDKAGASIADKSDEFHDWVGYYNSSEEFNSLGRVSDRDRAFLSSPDEYWQWESEVDKENYRSYKNSARTAYRRADFMIVAAITNRIISVIDAIRDAKRNNKTEKIEISDEKSYNYKFAIDPFSSNKQVTFTLYTPF